MNDEETRKESNLRPDTQSKIPFALREFGEIPKGYVPVYIVIDRESLQHVADYGLRREDNRVAKKFPELTEIFSEEYKEWTFPLDRTECVFAYPKRPEEISEGLGYNPERDVLLEAMIDPNSVRTYIADGSIFTEALARTSADPTKRSPGWKDSVKRSAESYWRSVMRFADYKKKVADGMDEYNFPEVLMDDVPTNRLRVVA